MNLLSLSRTHALHLWLAVCLCCAPAVAAMHPAASAPANSHAQGYLGIEFHDLTDEEARTLHATTTHGASVVMVDHDGPAGKAGLKPHDIIVALNGQVIDSAFKLRHLIHDAGAGVSVALSVIRNGTTLTLNARLASREDVERDAAQNLMNAPASAIVIHGFVESAPASPLPSDPVPPTHTPSFFYAMLHTTPFTGLALEAMEPQLAGFFGAPQGTGLLVNTVMPNSPAALAGLRAGDIVLRADSLAMRTPGDWMKHVKASKGQAIALTILRDKSEQTIAITPDLKHKSEVSNPALWPVPLTFAA